MHFRQKLCYRLFFFFEQKTAYEVRISDWSSDVCSSDLRRRVARHRVVHRSSPPCYDANDADHPQVPRGAGGRTRFPESASACIVPAMPHSAFVPLRIFSSYTMLDGADRKSVV